MVTLRLLQDVQFCPMCFVEGCMTYDWELWIHMSEFRVRCPYVSEAYGWNCIWSGRYGDFWRHIHFSEVKIVLAKKRSPSEAQEDDDNLPAAKRLNTNYHENN